MTDHADLMAYLQREETDTAKASIAEIRRLLDRISSDLAHGAVITAPVAALGAEVTRLAVVAGKLRVIEQCGGRET